MSYFVAPFLLTHRGLTFNPKYNDPAETRKRRRELDYPVTTAQPVQTILGKGSVCCLSLGQIRGDECDVFAQRSTLTRSVKQSKLSHFGPVCDAFQHLDQSQSWFGETSYPVTR